MSSNTTENTIGFFLSGSLQFNPGRPTGFFIKAGLGPAIPEIIYVVSERESRELANKFLFFNVKHAYFDLHFGPGLRVGLGNKSFIDSLVFRDNKRPITISLLNRINLHAMADRLGLESEFGRFFSRKDLQLQLL